MKFSTFKYQIILSIEKETIDEIDYPYFDIYKETSFLGMNLFGEIVNPKPFQNLIDAEDFLKLLVK